MEAKDSESVPVEEVCGETSEGQTSAIRVAKVSSSLLSRGLSVREHPAAASAHGKAGVEEKLFRIPFEYVCKRAMTNAKIEILITNNWLFIPDTSLSK